MIEYKQDHYRNAFVWLGLVLIFFGGLPAKTLAGELMLNLSVEEELNDNIFFTVDDDDPIEDYITTLAGGLRYSHSGERADAQALARVEQLYYADTDELDATDQFYSGNASYQLTSLLKAGVQGGYSRDSRPDRDVDATGLVMGTAIREVQRYGASLDCTLSEITSAGFSYNYQKENFDDPEFDDYDLHQAGVLFNRRLDKYFPNTTGRMNFSYARYEYTTVTIDYYSGTLGALWQWTETFHLQVDLGARYTESTFGYPWFDINDSGWGGVGAIKFGHQGEYSTTNLSLAHDVGAANGRDGSVERTSAVADVSYRFAEKGRVGMMAACYLNKADAGDLSTDDIDEQTLRLRPFVRWGLTDILALEASYVYSQIEDQVDDETRDQNVYLLKLIVNYPLFE